MKAIGIDFGTTNSAAAHYSQGKPEVLQIDTPPGEWAVLGFDKVLPSLVALDDQRRLLIGWQAKIASTDKRFEAVKRLFLQDETVEAGGEEFLVEEVATAIFAAIRRGVVEGGVDFTSAVITVPANSRGLARYRTKVCAGMAEIEPLALINEPTAAAMAYGVNAAYDQTLLVFDLGGGTLDVTVLEAVGGAFMELGSRGVGRLGGIDFDHAILRRIAEETPSSKDWSRLQRSALLTEIEKAKIRLSKQDEDTIVCDAVPHGYRLTRPLFNDLTKHLTEKVRTPVEQCLADIRMSPADIDQVLLVGGMSKAPGVRNLVAEVLGKEPAVGVDPLTAVAQGAAVAAAVLTGELADSGVFVSTEHALGTVISEPSGGLKFSQIIPRNQKLPAKATELYSPVSDYQEAVTVHVIEGDPAKPLDDADNVVLTALDVPFDPPRPADEAGFSLTYTYDTDGLLSVEIEDAASGQALREPLAISFKGSREPSELVGIAKNVKEIVTGDAPAETSAVPNDAVDPETRLLLQRARTKVIPFVDDEEAAVLHRLTDDLENASDATRSEAQKVLEEALRKYTYLF